MRLVHGSESSRSTFKIKSDSISWLLAIMCAVNMAGRKCLAGPFEKMHIFGILLAMFVINVSADQGVESKVLSVADTNWTLILEGEWMLML